MVITPENGLAMPHPVPQRDELEEIHELNRLFLILLQNLARQGADCLGLSAPIAGRIRDASSAALDGMAAFPRALFVLNLRHLDASIRIIEERVEETGDNLAQARHALTLTALLTAWHMSRQRAFLAHMFLGLSATESRYLRALPLSELHLLAASPGLLRCAFPEAAELWTSLLRHAEDGLPAALRLIGLQPQLSFDLSERGDAAGSLIA